MGSPFTPDEIDPVSMPLRSRYLVDVPLEEIEAGVQLDPADALRHPDDGPAASVTISRHPTWEVHHPEGVFPAHRGN
jgi:hypothetical protein